MTNSKFGDKHQIWSILQKLQIWCVLRPNIEELESYLASGNSTVSAAAPSACGDEDLLDRQQLLLLQRPAGDGGADAGGRGSLSRRGTGSSVGRSLGHAGDPKVAALLPEGGGHAFDVVVLKANSGYPGGASAEFLASSRTALADFFAPRIGAANRRGGRGAMPSLRCTGRGAIAPARCTRSCAPRTRTARRCRR